jgi:alkanesulfonate monooxygenase SsuD/methylene tetrahydromethanopterin reductase-like flavin-dependent oxidoreductase (luciferase family)
VAVRRVLIDIQFSSAHNDWPVLRDAVRQAEADGYDTTWVFDHFDGGVLQGDRAVLECFSLLGALAAATTRIGIGPLVANVANRHPAVLAAAAASVHRISQGRLRLGIGAGAAPGTPWAREHEERGIPLHPDLTARQAAVVRQIEELRAVCDAPVIVGVNSVSLATIAGTYADGVNVRLTSEGARGQLDAARRAAGDRPFETSGWAFVHDTESQRRAEEWGLDRLIVTSLERLD